MLTVCLALRCESSPSMKTLVLKLSGASRSPGVLVKNAYYSLGGGWGRDPRIEFLT